MPIKIEPGTADPKPPTTAPILPASPVPQRWPSRAWGVRRLGFIGLLLLCVFVNRDALSQWIQHTEPPTLWLFVNRDALSQWIWRTEPPEPPTEPSTRTAVFVLMGKTGTGKSSFIKLLNGVNPPSGHPVVDHGINSSTQQPEAYLTHIDKQKVLLLDTPGFDDSVRDNLEVLSEITSQLYLFALQPDKFAMRGVVFLHDISEIRFGGSQKKTLGILKALLGEANLGNVVVGTTMWDARRYKQQEQRERALQDDLWRGIHKTMRLPDEDKGAAERIIRELLKKKPALLLVQKEMLKPPHTLESTTVGKLAMPEGRLELENLQKEQKEKERVFVAETKRQEALLQKQIQDTERRFEVHGAQNQEREGRQKIKQVVEMGNLEEKLRSEFDKENKKLEAKVKKDTKRYKEAQDTIIKEQEAISKVQETINKLLADLQKEYRQRDKVWKEQIYVDEEKVETIRKILKQYQSPPNLTWYEIYFKEIMEWFEFVSKHRG